MLHKDQVRWQLRRAGKLPSLQARHAGATTGRRWGPRLRPVLQPQWKDERRSPVCQCGWASRCP